jgi:hypothetical protein
MHPSGVPPPGPAARGFAKRGARWLALAAALFGVLVLCCAGGVALVAVSLPGDHPRPGGSPADPGEASEHAAGLGDPVRDGRLTFVVHRVECAVASLGRPPRTKAADGQFCLVRVSVTNSNHEPVTFRDADQRAVGSDGSEYRPDSAAGALVGRGADLRLTRIAPETRIEGTVVYDVPTTSRIERLRWHESPRSAGAEVAVR